MAEKGYVLTESDVAVLRELVDRERRRPPARTRGASQEEPDSFAPEVYVVRSPAGGIPGLSEEVVGTSSYELLDDTLTGVECEVYRLNYNTDQMETSGAGTILVHNLSLFDVEGDTWTLVARDKFGSWFVIGSGADSGGGGPGPGPGGGPCELAKLHKSDCVLVTDGDQEVGLKWNSGSSRWTSAGVGTATDELYTYPGGTGIVEFWYEAGRLHLSINDLELLDCGNSCFSGGPLTGHTIDDTGTGSFIDCSGEIFTVCVECACCSIDGWGGEGWYCVEVGTADPADCEPLFLLKADRCDSSIVICSGPYDSEEEALAACPEPAPCITTNDSCLDDCVPETLYFHWTNVGACGSGTVAMNWTVDHWEASAVAFGGGCSPATIQLDKNLGLRRVRITGPFTETTTAAGTFCSPFSMSSPPVPGLNWTCCAMAMPDPGASWTINETP